MSIMPRYRKKKECRKRSKKVRQSERVVFFYGAKMQREYNLPKDSIANLIDQWILDEKAAEIMTLRLLKNHTYEKIAEEVEMSSRHIPRIIEKNIKILFKHGLKEMS